MKNVLQGYVGAPERARDPRHFADMLGIAGANLRGKVVSVMSAGDWSEHAAQCALALRDEEARNGAKLSPEQELGRVRVESTAFVVQRVVRVMLDKLGIRDMDMLALEGDDALELGAGYTLRRRSGSTGMTFHNHVPHSGFPVDLAVQAGDDRLMMIDTTGSWESHHGNIDTDGERLQEARRLIQAQSGKGPAFDLHVVDVLVNDGERQRVDRVHKQRPAVHTAAIPLRTEAYDIAARTLKKVG